MANPLLFSKSNWSTLLLVGVVGTAAGLNLAVMDLGSQPIESAATSTAAATTDGPQVQQVVVDVPVPAGQPAPAETLPVTASRQLSAAAPGAQGATAPPTVPTAAPTSPPATTAAASPTTAAPTTTAATAPTTANTAPITAPQTTAPSAPPGPTTEYLTYEFDGVAQIVVAYHDGRTLEFWSCTPEDGWAFAVEKNSAREVKVEFRRTGGGEGEATFQVKREDGELEVKRER